MRSWKCSKLWIKELLWKWSIGLIIFTKLIHGKCTKAPLLRLFFVFTYGAHLDQSNPLQKHHFRLSKENIWCLLPVSCISCAHGPWYANASGERCNGRNRGFLESLYVITIQVVRSAHDWMEEGSKLIDSDLKRSE